MLLHGKEKLFFDEVCTALHNHKIRKRDQKENEDVSAEALTTRGCNQSRNHEKKGKPHSKGRLGIDECLLS